MSEKVSIIILNWNGKDDTIDCLNSVFKIKYPNFEVIVVDNGSVDGSVETIRRKFPQVTLIENKKNLGFAGGNNVGILHALDEGTDFIFILNNDTVVDPNILTELFFAYKSLKNPGFLGCKIYFYNEHSKIQYFGGVIVEDPLLMGYHPEYGLLDDGSFNSIKETQYITGCDMFASREVWEKTGGFDENYYLYWEDTDLSLKATKMGYRNYVVPKAIVFHKEGVSLRDFRNIFKNFYLCRNRIYFAKKHDKTLNPFKHSIKRIADLLKTDWEFRYTAVVGEVMAYLFGKLGRMGKAPAVLNVIVESQLEKRARLKFINLKKKCLRDK